MLFLFFFFNDTATTEIYTLSLHDALPISDCGDAAVARAAVRAAGAQALDEPDSGQDRQRSEEHTSELQSHSDLVCRLLLEKKKKERTNENTRVTKTMFGPSPLSSRVISTQ